MQIKRIKQLLSGDVPVDTNITTAGWLRTKRDARGFSFLEINDGSCLVNLQVIAEQKLQNYEKDVKRLSTGCSIVVTGHLKASPAQGQRVEVLAAEIRVVGWADPEKYPLQKKHHSFEFLREIAHLRPRTNALGAVARIRSRMSRAIHRFFEEHGFVLIHTPVITTSDCEGAGEMFQVVTGEEISRMRAGGQVPAGFFGRPAGLTVSGQLQAEVYAQALGSVYTFGPTFRAENSNTSRHLAEFWMLEPEMAFCDLACCIEIAEKLLKFLLADVLEQCDEDMALLDRFIEKDLIAKLRRVIEHDFVRITYSEAVDTLLTSGKAFDFPVSWGVDLQSEHERYLTEDVYGLPLIVTDYPAAIKPFYMRLSDDGTTVAAMDILIAGVGEIIGGSQREERHDVLLGRMQQSGIEVEDYGWYLDLRKYGTTPHAGFGLGFERLVQFVTGMGNIREAIPFPRAPGFAPC